VTEQEAMFNRNAPVNLSLELSEPSAVPASLAKRWSCMAHQVGKYDFPYLLFLGEMLGMVVEDGVPRFACVVYSGADMFGGCDRDWTLATPRATIHRRLKREISESWQHVEVEYDELQISGLPGNVFIDWDGDISGAIRLTLGNITDGVATRVIALAEQLFGKVAEEVREGQPEGALRAELKREQKFAGNDRPVPASVGRLLAALRDADSDVGLAALARLRAGHSLGDPAIWPAIHQALRESHWIVKTEIAKALGTESGPGVVAGLIDALQDDDESVRAAAIDSLGRLGDARAVPALLATFADDSRGVRRSAVSAVGTLLRGRADGSTLVQMAAMLADPDQYVRDTTAWTLRTFSDPILVGPLLQALEDPYFAVRHGAVLALANQRDPRVVPALIQHLDDSEEAVQYSAAECLGQLDDKRAILPLAQLTRQTGISVQLRQVASEAMKRLDASS
jgi:HEAT repeat protein